MDNTLERIAKWRHKTKMDKRSGLWQVDLPRPAPKLVALVTPKSRVFRLNVMPLGIIAHDPLAQKLVFLHKILPVCQENHLRIKLKKCEVPREQMEYLGFDVTYCC